MSDRPETVALIGAPTDIGAAHRGASMGPEALRVAGIDLAFRELGIACADLGNLTGPPNPNAAPVGGYRHVQETALWCGAIKTAVHDALVAGRLPILMGGDHSLAIGSIGGVAQYCADQEKPLCVVWLDAHADFNTPETSPSGNLHGMPVAVLTGKGPAVLTGLGHSQPIVESSQFIQIGIRSVDHVEKRAVVDSDLVVYDMREIDERGMRTVVEEALATVSGQGAHLHLSFDVDFLDPTIAPGVGTTVTGGPSYRESQLLMEMLHDSKLVRSMDIMELNPAFDTGNQTANLVVELVASLFGEQILSRRRPSLP